MMRMRKIPERDESGRLGVRSLWARSAVGFLLAFAALLTLPAEAQGQADPPAISADVPPSLVQDPGTPDHFKSFDQIAVLVTFTRAVTVTGNPRIGLDIGGERRNATYFSGINKLLLFKYIVSGDDLDADGIDIIANSLELGGGSITGTGDGAAAVLSHPSQLATDTRRPVDGIAPTARLGGDRSGYEHPDNLVSVIVQFSEPVTGLTIDDFTVTHGIAEDLEEESTPVPGNAYSFVITHAGEGIVTVMLPSGAVLDAAGNGNRASPELRIVVADPARVTITPSSSNTVEGEPVVFTLHRSKDNGTRTVELEVSQNGDFLSGTTSFGATFSTTPTQVSVEFPAGVITKTLSLNTEDDYADEADGSVTLTVQPDPTEFGYVAGTPHEATALVLDNDVAPYLYITQNPTIPIDGVSWDEVQEGAAFKFILIRTHDAGPQTLDVEISQQGDFLAASHPDGLTIPSDGRMQVSFPAGTLTTAIILNTKNDTVGEADGLVTLTVLPRPNDSLYPVLVVPTKTMTIRDDDAPPTVTVAADVASVTEGSDVTFTVTRTNAPGEHTRWMLVRLEIDDPDGALARGTDLSRFIAILEGQTEQAFSLETVDDQVAEPDGNITVRVLSNSSLAPYLVGTPDSATVEVADNEDPIVSVSAVASTVTEGSDAQFRFSRIGSLKNSLTVGVNIFGHHKIMSPATRTLVENPGPLPDTTVIFGAGMTEAILSLTTEADLVNEGDGEVRVSIKGNSGYATGGNGSAKLLVQDDDIPEVTLRWITPAMTLQNNVWVGTMIEGEAFDWSVDCSGNTAAPGNGSSRIPIRMVREMNHPLPQFSHYDVDFSSRHPCAGDVNAHLFLASIKDGRLLYTGPENGEIRFDIFPQKLEFGDRFGAKCYLDDLPGTPQNVRFCPKFTLGAVTSARIVVRNRNPTITVEALDEEVNEGEPARFKLTRIWAADLINPEPLLDLSTTVDFTVRAAGSYATAVPSDQSSFSNGVTEIIVEIPTLDNDLPGEDGSVTFEILPGSTETQAGNVGGTYEVYDFLDGVTPAGKNSRVATVRILNDDVFPLLSITDATAEEGDPVEFVVTLSGAHVQAITVDWATSDGTAELTIDYPFDTSSGTLAFAPGETEKTISVNTLEDDVPELDKTFTVTLSNPVEVTLPTPATATGTITNDDTLPVVTILAYETPILDGNNPKFIVSRQGFTDDRLDVQISLTKDGDPLPNVTVAIPVGQYSAIHTINHPSTDAQGQDYQYSATVLASTNTYRIGIPGSATVNLVDDYDRGLAVEAHADSYTFEQVGDVINLTYIVTNVGNVATGAPVRAYTNLNGDFVVSANPIPANVNLPNNLDHRAQVTVSYTITAADVTTGSVLLSWYAGDGLVLSAQDDVLISKEGRIYRYTITNPATTDPDADDEDQDLTLQIWRQDNSRDTHEVRIYTTDGTATQPQDYAAADETLTFSYKQRQSVTLDFNDDGLDEPNESFHVYLVDAATGDILYAYARIGIDDDDDPVEIFVTTTHGIATNESWPAERGQPVVQVSLSLPGEDDFELAADGSGHVVELSYETVDGTATAGEDYTHVSGRLRYELGTNLQSFTIPILDDRIIEDSESFYIRFSDGQHVTIPADQELFEMTINDDDVRSTSISLSMDPTEVAEGAGPTEITVTATLNSGVRPANSQESVVVWQVLPGTATLGTDYAAVPAVTMTIPPGQVSGTATFTFTPLDDGTDEDSFETVIVAGSSFVTSLEVIPLAGLTLQIRDDDTREVVIAPTEIALDEGENGTYTVALNSQPTGAVTVIAGFPAGEGISLVNSTLTFNATNWATPQSVTVTASPDADAADEQVTINFLVLGADYGSVVAPHVDVRVTDDDTPSTLIVLVSSRTSVTEDGGDKTIRITAVYLNAAAKEDTTVRIQVEAKTAFPGSDFVAVEPFDVVIPAGSTAGMQTFTLSPVNDDVAEDDETLSFTGQVTVGGVPVDGALPVNTATVTINDDDSRGVVVTPTSLTMEEGGEESYTIVLTSAPSETTYVAITVPANAHLRVSPSGFYFHSGNWNVAQTVRVTSLSDADVLDDTVILTHAFSGGDYDSIVVDDMSVTITEPSSSAMLVEGVRGAEGSGPLEFVVTLAQAINTTATVQYRTVGMAGNNGVTATAGEDYTDQSGTLTFAPGETRKTVLVSLGNNTLNEAEEHFQLVLENPTNAELPQPTPTMRTVQGIIEDDDPLPVVSVAGSTANGWSYADETAGPLSYTVRLSEASSREVEVDYTTADRSPATRLPGLQTATATADYSPRSGTLTFLPGETVKPLTVQVVDDKISEDNEVLALELSNPRNAVLSNQGWGVIRSEDVHGLQLTPPTLTLDEGTSSTYMVALSSQPTAAVTVTLTPSASVTLDLSTLSFQPANWSTAQTVTVTAVDDDDATDGTATITHSFAGGDYQGVSAVNMTVTIREDDERQVVVSVTSLTVAEGGSSTYTVVLASQPTGSVTVTPLTSGNPDVTVSPSPLTFTTGNWSIAQTVTVSVVHDADAVNDIETVSHEVSGADYETETADDVSITVSDDETLSTDVVLSVDPVAVAEDAGSKTVTVTATLNHAPRLVRTVVTVTVGEADDAATEGTDYAQVGSHTLYIVAGATSGTVAFTLTPTGDDVDEADETLTVGGAVQGLTVTPAAVTIEDNDARGVGVSATSLTVPEGGSSTYSVVLHSQPAGNVTVTVNDPTDNTDVTADPASLTFTDQDWDTAQTVTVMTVQDVDGDDDTATITHTVASTADSTYEGISTDDVTVTVDDDETASSTVILSVDPAWADEDTAQTNVRLTAELNGAPRAGLTTVTVTVGATEDSAVEGTDYETIGELTLNIGAGQTSTFLTIPFRPINDEIGEGDEGISITGTTTETGLTVTETALVLFDDETPRSVTLTAVPDSVAEDGAPVTVVVTVTVDVGAFLVETPVTVTVGDPGDSATEGTDYAAVGDFTVTILAGGTTEVGSFQFTPMDDSFGEGDEKTSVTGRSTGPSAVVNGTEVTIIDDETLSTEIGLSVTPDSLGEGASATTLTVTGTLNDDPRRSPTIVTVIVGALIDVAVEGADYETVNDFTLTIDAGQTTGSTTFQLIPTDDAIDEVDEALTVSGTTDVTGLVVTTTSVTITDDDTDGVTVNPTAVTITEGGTVTYTVVLDTEPAGNVTVTVNDPTDNTDVTADPAALTFTDQNWNVAQTVTVSAAQDGDAADETATVTHTVASTADADYQGISTADVAVTLEDDAPETVTVSYEQGTYTVAEGSSVTVKVKLSVAPERTVTVPINKAPQGGVTTADYSGVPTSVTFNSTDTEKTFSFAAASDSVDDDGESVKLTFGTLPTGVTEGTTKESVVSITDDDVPAVTVSYEQGTYTVAEGSSVTVKVKLSVAPERTVTVPINRAPRAGRRRRTTRGCPPA